MCVCRCPRCLNGWGYTHFCVACLGEKHGLRSRALAVSTAMCFARGRSDPAWRSFARTLRLAFPRALVPLLPRHSSGCGPGVRKGIGQRRRALPFLCLHLTDSVPHFRVRKHALRVLPVRYCGQASLHFEKHSHSSRHVIFLWAQILCAAVIVCKNTDQRKSDLWHLFIEPFSLSKTNRRMN